VKVYRGNPAAARNYVEADHARVDDYYLAEGTGLAERFVATPDGVEAVGALDGDGYEAWVAGLDPLSREPRGRLRQDASAVRFVEVVVNGPKTWSLAASLDPDVADAYDAADRYSCRLSGSRPPRCVITRRVLAIHIVIFICRSTRECGLRASGVACTLSGFAT